CLLEVPEAIMVEQAQLCRENSLYFGTRLIKCKEALPVGGQNPTGGKMQDCTSLFAKLREAGGKYFLSRSMLAEHTSIFYLGQTSDVWKTRGIDAEKMNLQSLHDWFVEKDRKAVQEAKRAGLPLTDNV